MSSFLKGNFQVKENVDKKNEKKKTLESRFEQEALKHLGGSVTFVKKKKVDWNTKILPFSFLPCSIGLTSFPWNLPTIRLKSVLLFKILFPE